MLLFRKIIFVPLFFFTACGFSPLYTESNASKLFGQIRIQEPHTQEEFIFYSHLVNRFGDIGDKYILDYEIFTSKSDKALNFEGAVHRIEIFGSVSFSLKERESGAMLLSDKEEFFVSYSNSGSTGAVLNVERTTKKELVVLLADKVADRVSLVIVDKNS